MADKDKYLMQKNGKPYRTADGKPMKLDDFDQDPTFHPELYDKTDEEMVEEFERLGMSVPSHMKK